ncbi:MAG TPA: flagellar brake protein [Clostridiales bacterium]|nr:flagellar brake protein [Clostridiales bacterium]
MLLREMKTGTKLQLELYDEMGKRIDKQFVSQFEYTEDEKTAIIHVPLYEGVIYPIHTSLLLYVFFSQAEKLYSFKAEIIDRFTKGDIPFIRIKILGKITNVQRRSYYRLPCSLPAIYRIASQKEFNCESEHGEFIESNTINISGSGVCILLKDNIQADTLVECYLELKEDYEIYFLGRVVRVTKCQQNNNYRYKAGIAFEHIKGRHRDAIVKFIFEEQRKLRRKGFI